MSVYDYDEEGHKKILREEGHLEELISQIIPKVNMNKIFMSISY